MKKIKISLIIAMSLALFTVGTSFVSSAQVNSTQKTSDRAKTEFAEKSKRGNREKIGTPVNVIKITALVTGKTEAEVKESLKTQKIGDLLISSGKLNDFKAAYLAEFDSNLKTAVKSGSITQTQAENIYAIIKEKIDAYDGTNHLFGNKDHKKKHEQKSDQKTESSSVKTTKSVK